MDRIIKITIPGQLPDYNTAVAKAKGDKYGIMYRKWKAETDERIAWEAREQLRHLPDIQIIEERSKGKQKFRVRKKVKTVATCAMLIRWYSPNRKKDQDNIEHGKKYILDGLQWGSIIPQDTWNCIGGNTLHEHYVDKDNPRVEIYLLENRVLTFEVKATQHETV